MVVKTRLLHFSIICLATFGINLFCIITLYVASGFVFFFPGLAAALGVSLFSTIIVFGKVHKISFCFALCKAVQLNGCTLTALCTWLLLHFERC